MRYIRFSLLPALVLTVLAGAYLAPVNKTLTNADDCDLTLQACTYDKGSISFSIEFMQPPVSEEELFINFDLPTNWVIENAWIEGVNMYMGKTPVMFEDVQDNTNGITFLGSCNLAEMKWLLYVDVKQKDTTASHRLVASFSTFR